MSRPATVSPGEIFEQVAPDAPQNAPALVRHILDAMELPKVVPHRAVVRGQPSRAGYPVRSIGVQSYVIYFRALDGRRVVRVVRVAHGARRRPHRFE